MYMPMVRELCGLSPDVEKHLKDTIKEEPPMAQHCSHQPHLIQQLPMCTCARQAIGINRRAGSGIYSTLPTESRGLREIKCR